MKNRFVDYQWSQDGVIERCELMEDTLKEEMPCYHCDRKMEAGEKVAFLFPIENDEEYALHPECAKKACTMA